MIQLNLTDQEYRELLKHYTLGTFIEGEIYEKGPADFINEGEFLNNICKQGVESGSKEVQKIDDKLYGTSVELEEEAMEIFEDFKEYVSSGQADKDDQELNDRLKDMGLLWYSSYQLGVF